MSPFHYLVARKVVGHPGTRRVSALWVEKTTINRDRMRVANLPGLDVGILGSQMRSRSVILTRSRPTVAEV